MEQKPSVGRIVHYQEHKSPTRTSEPKAAIITAVREAPAGTLIAEAPTGQVVDLFVLIPPDTRHDKEVPFSETPKPGHWNWPSRV